MCGAVRRVGRLVDGLALGEAARRERRAHDDDDEHGERCDPELHDHPAAAGQRSRGRRHDAVGERPPRGEVRMVVVVRPADGARRLRGLGFPGSAPPSTRDRPVPVGAPGWSGSPARVVGPRPPDVCEPDDRPSIPATHSRSSSSMIRRRICRSRRSPGSRSARITPIPARVCASRSVSSTASART